MTPLEWTLELVDKIQPKAALTSEQFREVREAVQAYADGAQRGEHTVSTTIYAGNRHERRKAAALDRKAKRRRGAQSSAAS